MSVLLPHLHEDGCFESQGSHETLQTFLNVSLHYGCIFRCAEVQAVGRKCQHVPRAAAQYFNIWRDSGHKTTFPGPKGDRTAPFLFNIFAAIMLTAEMQD